MKRLLYRWFSSFSALPVPARAAVHARGLARAGRARRRRRDRARHEPHGGLPGPDARAGPRCCSRRHRASSSAGAFRPAASCRASPPSACRSPTAWRSSTRRASARTVWCCSRSSPIRARRSRSSALPASRARSGGTGSTGRSAIRAGPGSSRRSAAPSSRRVPAPAGPSGETEVTLEITPLRRGHVRFTGCHARAARSPGTDPRAEDRSRLPQSLLVLPKRYPMAGDPDRGHRESISRAASRWRRPVGESEEFVALRDYRAGDPMRRIHWQSWARVGRPVVREYQDEFFVRHALVLDTFAEPTPATRSSRRRSPPPRRSRSRCETQESLLDLMFVGPEAYCFTAGRGVGHTDQLLEVLACVGAVSRQAVSRPAPRRDGASRRAQRLRVRAARVGRRAAGACPPARGARHADPRVRRSGERGALGALPGHVHRLEVGRIGEGLARL